MLGLRPATALTPADELASHRAVYELKLAQTRGKSATVSARGRILYDFSGNACEGYVLQFRQVSELDNGEGKITLSDLRATTWEEGTGKSFRFNSQNYLNEQQIDAVDGSAERTQDKVTIKLDQAGRQDRFDCPERHLSDRSHAPHHRGRARGQDHSGSAGLRRLGNGREGLQHAERDRARDCAERACFRPMQRRARTCLPASSAGR